MGRYAGDHPHLIPKILTSFRRSSSILELELELVDASIMSLY